MINIYSDNYQAALKYLKDTEVNIHNILVMARDFNIRDREWDPSCYNTVKGEAVIFFIYSLGFYIGFYFGFTFLLLYWWWQWRGTWHCSHMTCHMMWYHKSLEWTRMGWSGLDG